jgi:hypothetical protein
MDSTLYILRRKLQEIPESLLSSSDWHSDVVFLEQAVVASHHVSEIGSLMGSRRAFTYEDLIEKVFAAERVVVI